MLYLKLVLNANFESTYLKKKNSKCSSLQLTNLMVRLLETIRRLSSVSCPLLGSEHQSIPKETETSCVSLIC